MEELSSVESLINFGKQNGLTFHTNEDIRKHILFVGNPNTKYKFVVFDLPDKNMHLVFSDISTGNAGGSFLYCGLFLKIPICKNEVKIRPRFFIDRLSFSKKFKTGNAHTDKKVVIFCENKEYIPINTDTMVIRKLLELNKSIGPLELISVKKSMSFIPLLYGNHWIAININMRWLLEPEEINLLIEKGSELLLKAKT